jgi:hypothetical protein
LKNQKKLFNIISRTEFQIESMYQWFHPIASEWSDGQNNYSNSISLNNAPQGGLQTMASNLPRLIISGKRSGKMFWPARKILLLKIPERRRKLAQ